MSLLNGSVLNSQAYNQRSLSNGFGANITGAAAISASLGPVKTNVNTNYFTFFGVFNSVPLNKFALNQTGISGATTTMGGQSNISVIMGVSKPITSALAGSSTVSAPSLNTYTTVNVAGSARVAVLNGFSLNSLPLNGAQTTAGISGNSSMSASLTKTIPLSLASSALGVFNSLPLNRLPLNGVITNTNGGTSAMTAMLMPITILISANVNGAATVSGPLGIAAIYDGGYNSAAFMQAVYGYANYTPAVIVPNSLPSIIGNNRVVYIGRSIELSSNGRATILGQ